VSAAQSVSTLLFNAIDNVRKPSGFTLFKLWYSRREIRRDRRRKPAHQRVPQAGCLPNPQIYLEPAIAVSPLVFGTARMDAW